MSTKKILLLISLLPLLMGAARIQNESIKANAGINFSKLEALPSAQVLVGNASNVATPRDISGDATIANTGAMTIAANAVTDGKLRQSAGLSVIGRAANSTGDVADITAASDFEVFRRSGTSVGFGAIDISQSATIGTSILQEANGGTGQNSYLPGQVLIGDNSNGLTAAYLQAGSGISVTSGSGTITIAATGGSGSAEAVTKAIAQTGHGFAVGDVIRHNGTIYVEAQADADANAEVYGIVSAVADANNFTVTTSGYISGLSGLTAGAAHFLSASTAGAITATEPTGVNQVSKPVLVAVSTSAGYVIHSRGFVVGGNSGGGGATDWVEISSPDITVPCSVGAETDIFVREVGDTLEVRGSFRCATTVSSGNAKIDFANYTIDLTKLTTYGYARVGSFIAQQNSNTQINNSFQGGDMFVDGTDNNSVWFATNVASLNYTYITNMTSILGTNEPMQVNFSVPIQ